MRFLNHLHSKKSAEGGAEYTRVSAAECRAAAHENAVPGRRTRYALLICLAAAVAAFLFFNSQFCYAIMVNGETVGTTKDKDDADEIIAIAEQHASEILGYEYSLDETVAVSAWLGGMGGGEIEHEILGRIEDIEQLYVLYVDGEAVGAAEDGAVLSAILSDILDSYTQETTASVSFVQEVSVKHDFVSKDVLRDAEKIAELIAPGNEVSEHSLDVETVEITERTEPVAYTTEYVEDDTMYEQSTRVLSAGVDGELLVTERKTFLNGVETDSFIMETKMTLAPVAEVIAEGTMERPPTASWGEYIWPCSGTVTSLFGYRSVRVGSSNHKGLDIADATGTDIFAADGGEVTHSGTMSGYGYIIIITHDNGDKTYYAHCSKLLVSVGERVARGQLIAKMGSTGVSSGPHCHFEIRKNGTEFVDPMEYLPDDPDRPIRG